MLKKTWDDRYVYGRDSACELLAFRQLGCLCLCVEKKSCVEREEEGWDPRAETAMLGFPRWPWPPLTSCEACWVALIAGKRQQSSQYPNSTPDAWTPFFLSTWMRNTAKVCTRESGHTL